MQISKRMPIDYKKELNESQLAAVEYVDGPSLVIAGAGAGKTRVLTYKIAYLLEHGYDPSSILALTFTNKAADEMKSRIARQVGWGKARYLWMGTFHSVFSRILRREAATLGFTPRFTIYDQADSRSLIKSIIKEMGLDEKAYKPASVQCHISNAKNQLVSPRQYAADAATFEADNASRMPAIRDIYARYCDRCKQADVMDFDDLLVYMYLLLERHPEVGQFYADRFRFILVDEYQDTNCVQHRIVQLLAQGHRHVCVVGDDAQSIYSFRGARIENILQFTRQYPEAKLFKLEQNYRSTQLIVNAANSLIEKNQNQIQKHVFSQNAPGAPIQVSAAYSDVEEGEIVVGQIQELRRKEHYAYADFAILYRTNAQSRIFEEALRKRTLPYRIYGGLSFYQRKEIKDVIAYFRLAVNPADEEAFKRVVNYPARGIGNTTVSKLVEAATKEHVSLWQVLCAPLDYGVNLTRGTCAKLHQFQELIEVFITDAGEKDAYEMGQEVVTRSGILSDIYQDRTPENLSRQENVQELLNGMHDFCLSRQEEGDGNTSLSDFLSDVSLLSEQDMDKGADDDKVTLMTIHAAKGLEFKAVFVVGMEEGIFPGNMAQASPSELEEERRLFYVALTRAENYCYLSFARSRFRYGKVEFGTPSRFLRDIDPTYLQLPQGGAGGELSIGRHVAPSTSSRIEMPMTKRAETERPLRPAASPRWSRVADTTSALAPSRSESASVQAGQWIEHERFGIGEVLRVEGTGENRKATVKFQHAGEKQLLLKFARFKIKDA